MRPDGRRIKGLDPFFQIVPHLMPKRYDAQVFFSTELDYTGAKKYINAKRKEGVSLSFMSLFVAAYVRAVSQLPAINRFIMRKKIYARNEITVSFALIRPEGTQEDSMETAVKLKFEPTDTVFEIAKKMDDVIKTNRKMDDSGGTIADKLAKFFMGIPIIPGGLIALLKGLDKIGMLPKALLDGIPFHASLWITNMASIGMGSVYHHLYDFGNSSAFVGMGKLEDRTKDGKKKRVIPLDVVADERICAGITFAKGFGLIKKYLDDPTQLESPPEQVIEDIK